jgi:hypothetical protein
MGALLRSNRRFALALPALAAAIVMSLFVLRVSSAGFSATTDNGSNSWQTGSVTLTDNDGGTAMFNASMLDGGQTVTRCINVTYTGFTTGTHVKMFTTAVSGDLAPYLDVTVDEGTGATDAACTGFTDDPAAAIFTGTLAAFGTAATSYATGVGDWQPAGSPVTRTYRISTTVQNDANAQGKTAAATFNWVAQH